MFACALYPADTGFLDSVKEEVRYQVGFCTQHLMILTSFQKTPPPRHSYPPLLQENVGGASV